MTPRPAGLAVIAGTGTTPPFGAGPESCLSGSGAEWHPASVIVRDRHRRASVDEEHAFGAPEVIEFETGPVRGRRRGFDPVILASVAVTGLLVAAVMKPWGAAPPPVPSSTDRPSADGRRANDGASIRPTRRPTADRPQGMREAAFVLPVPRGTQPTPLPPRGLVREILRTYDAWGARIILEAPAAADAGDPVATRQVLEAWAPAEPRGDLERPGGSGTEDVAVFDVGDHAVRLIGITMPTGVAVRRLHVTIDRPLGRRTRLNVVAVSDGRDRYCLFAPATLDGRINTWPAGRYDIALEADGAARAITIVLEGDAPPA